MIRMAAPWVNAISTGEVIRLSSQPKRTKPSATCVRPVNKHSQTASSIHCALPGAASPVSEVPTSSAVSAVGPTDKRVDAQKSTATSAGSIEA